MLPLTLVIFMIMWTFIVCPISAMGPDIILSSHSTYSCQHLNLIWSITQDTFPLLFEYKTSDAKDFSRAIITEISQNIYSINGTFNMEYQPANCTIQFRILMDKSDEQLSDWSHIFEFEVSQSYAINWIPNKYLYYAAGGVVALGGSIVVLPLLGFTASGIAAGSVASAIHSSIGIVASGSTFAGLQSAGTAGMSFLTQGIITSVGTSIAGVVVETVGEEKIDEMFQDLSETGKNVFGTMSNAASNKFNEWFGSKQDTEDTDDPITDKIHNLREWYQNEQREGKILNEDQKVYVWFREKVALGIYTEYYYELFIQNGFDSISEIKIMSKLDIEEMGITKASHLKYILKEIKDL